MREQMEAVENGPEKGTEKGNIRWGLITIVLTIVAAVLAGMTIGFELIEAEVAVYVFKPLTITTILAIALLSLEYPTVHYRWMIVFGLVLSLIGDILLMLPYDLFLSGLVAFLIAQIFYTSAFISAGGFYRSIKGALPFLLYGVVLVIYLWPSLGDMLIPALVYTVVILTMAWQALGQWRQTKEKRALLAFIGALLFVASDTALAINRFANPLELAPLIILGTYYPAQWLIAVSVGRDHL